MNCSCAVFMNTVHEVQYVHDQTMFMNYTMFMNGGCAVFMNTDRELQNNVHELFDEFKWRAFINPFMNAFMNKIAHSS